MNLTEGNLYLNRTVKYLIKILKDNEYNAITTIFNNCSILAMGIEDKAYTEVMGECKHLFLLVSSLGKFDEVKGKFINMETGKKTYDTLLANFKKTKHFVEEYQFKYSPEHWRMIVIAIPNYQITYDNFVEGLYSKMYSPKQIESFKLEKKYPSTLVLTKNKEAKEIMVKMLADEFGVSEDMITLPINGEYDIKPTNAQERFNYL